MGILILGVAEGRRGTVVNYFLEAIDYIERDEIVPYYLCSKIYDQTVFLDHDQAFQILQRIMGSERSVHLFRYFERYKILSSNFRFLYELKKIGQKKHKSKNVFDHTMRVLDSVPVHKTLMKLAAIFHDIGKGISVNQDNNFYKHAEYSLKFTEIMAKLYNMKEPEADELCTIIKYHMLPLEYQRNPIWSDNAIRNFIDKCHPHALSVVEFSYYDKKAETDKTEFLEPILELDRKIKKLI